MADNVPDPTRPDPGAGWPAHFMYQVRMLFREFGGSQIGMLVITALLGYIGVQSYNNAGHADDLKNAVVTTHAETTSAIKEAKMEVVAKADVAAAKADAAKEASTMTAKKIDNIASDVKKDKK